MSISERVIEPNLWKNELKDFVLQTKHLHFANEDRLIIQLLGVEPIEKTTLHGRIYSYVLGVVFVFRAAFFHHIKEENLDLFNLREKIFQSLEKTLPHIEDTLYVSVLTHVIWEVMQTQRFPSSYGAVYCTKCVKAVTWLNNSDKTFNSEISRLQIPLGHEMDVSNLSDEEKRESEIHTEEQIARLRASLNSYSGYESKGWTDLNKAILEYRQVVFTEKCSLKVLFTPPNKWSTNLQQKRAALVSQLTTLCQRVENSQMDIENK